MEGHRDLDDLTLALQWLQQLGRKSLFKPVWFPVSYSFPQHI